MRIAALFLVLAALLLLQHCDRGVLPTRGKETEMSKTGSPRTLIVTVSPDVLADGSLKSDSMRVKLTNADSFPIAVVGRLAIGYDDSDSREIYAIIRDRRSGQVVGKRAQLYQRESISRNQIKVLPPGGEVETEFNLFEWYDVPGGDLEMQIVYDSTEAAKRFPEIQSQIVKSDFVPFRTR